MLNAMWVKTKESLSSVSPITAIVLFLHFAVSPMPKGMLALFLFGSVLLILGMSLFTLGADNSMMPMGELIGSKLTKSKKIGNLIMFSFLIGFGVTIAEPDLQVLASQVPAVPNAVLILSVAFGVGIFLVLSLIRIVLQIKLSYILITFYAVVFALAIFSDKNYLAVAFDSGGVTTGPITVPFIMAFGIGIAAVQGGKRSRDDSFGLVALCSVGPILAVLIMGMFFKTSGQSVPSSLGALPIESLSDVLLIFVRSLRRTATEVGLALLPIIILFVFFQVFVLKLKKHRLIRISVGLLYTFVGLVLFLTGVNIGFSGAGAYIGESIALLENNWVLIPIGMLMGFFVVLAEPAVHVLNDQVEEITVGAISKSAMLISLSVGVSLSLGLAMLRVLTGISIWYLLVPGYALALALTFFVPPIFTAIAFDSGGVASGPMTATFLLPFAVGASSGSGGNIMTDAFGIVAMVAMTPLITIQILGLVYQQKLKHTKDLQADEQVTEDDIIEYDE